MHATENNNNQNIILIYITYKIRFIISGMGLAAMRN